MSFHSKFVGSTFQHVGLFLTAGALVGLVSSAAACSSDSNNDPAKGGASAAGSGSGGTSSTSAGTGTNDAGKANDNGGTGNVAGSDAASGGAPDESGGTAAGGNSQGGSSATAGSSSGGSDSGTMPGDDNWACVEAGGSCICQNNANPKDANSCTGTYKCCFAVPLGASTRCQCQDPYTSKCEDLAHALTKDGKVVDHCPP